MSEEKKKTMRRLKTIAGHVRAVQRMVEEDKYCIDVIHQTQAIKRVFDEHAHKLSISSTKSQLGHSLGASGGIELLLTVKAIHHGVIPPTINLENPDPACDLDYTPLQPKERQLRVAMSNSFGFGGHNAAVVVGQLRNGAA